jgi:hypothetical protein
MTTRGQVLSMLLLAAGVSGVLSADVAPSCGGSKRVRPEPTPAPTIAPPTTPTAAPPVEPRDQPAPEPPVT